MPLSLCVTFQTARSHFLLCLAVVLSLFASPARAGTTWDGGGGANLNWSSALNWSPDGAPANDGSAPIVFAGSVSLNPNADAAWDIASLTFSNTAGAFTLGGSQLTIRSSGITNNSANLETINNALALNGSQTWTAANGNLAVAGPINLGIYALTLDGAANTTLSGAITGTSNAGLNKNGNGTLTLSGATANVFTGATNVYQGVLQLGKTGGAAAFGNSLNNYATVRLLAANQFAGRSGSINGLFDLNGFSDTIGFMSMTGGSITTGAGTLTIGSNIQTNANNVSSSITGNATISVGVPTFNVALGTVFNGVDLDIPATLTGNGFSKTGNGTLRLAAANTFAIGPNLIGGMTLFANNGAAGINPITFGGGSIAAEATRSLPNGLIANTASAIVDGTGDLTLTGIISGTKGLTKNGAGPLTISGASANTYAGLTTVNQGTLNLAKTAGVAAVPASLTIGDFQGGAASDIVRLQAANQIADAGTLTVTSSGLLDLNGFSESVGYVYLYGGAIKTGAGTLSLASNLQSAGNVTSSISGSLNLFGGAGFNILPTSAPSGISLDVPAVISNGNILMYGGGTARFSGANTFASGIRIDSGALLLGNDAAAGTGIITLNGGAIGGDLGPRTIANPISLIANSSITGPGDLTLTGPITGNFTLNKNGPGALTLPSATPFTALTLSAGTLVLGNTAAAGNGNLSLAGGTLRVTSTAVAITNPVTLDGDVTIAASPDINFNTTTQLTGDRMLNVSFGTATFNGSIYSVAGNSLTKTGFGTLALTGGNTLGGLIVNDGTLAMSGGYLTGTLTNRAYFTFTGGTLNSPFDNQGAASIQADFTAGAGVTNSGSISISTGRNFSALGTGLDNFGSFTLAGGQLGGASITNDFGGALTGAGTITAPFTNYGTLTPAGLLTAAATTNFGLISLGANQSFRPTTLNNSGTVTLTGGSLSGAGLLNNLAAGLIQGGGGVTLSLPANNGVLFANSPTLPLTITNLTGNSSAGTLKVADGSTLNAFVPFTSAGQIQLAGPNATLAGQQVTNTGTVSGSGQLSLTVLNSGVISAQGGKLALTAAGNTNTPTGQLQVGPGATLLYAQGLAVNAGSISIAGGTFSNNNQSLANAGTISFTTGAGSVAAPINNTASGKLIVTGGATATFYNPIGNVAGSEIRVSANATALFLGSVNGPATFSGSGTKYFEGGVSSAGAIAAGGITIVEQTASVTADYVIENALTISGQVNLRPSASTSKVSALSITSTGRLDIANNSLIVDYPGASPVASIRTAIQRGQITSALLNSSTAIGYAEAFELFGASGGPFGDQSADGTSVLVRYTLAGDANLDGAVDFLDLAKLAQSYNSDVSAQTQSWWNRGDFNGDGAVDFLDLARLAQNYNTALPSTSIPSASASFQADLATAFASVPEPSTTLLAAVACCSMMLRHQRRATKR
jgi:fibronectin-binding autotransporter adhesin